jgi:hypothetical protein
MLEEFLPRTGLTSILPDPPGASSSGTSIPTAPFCALSRSSSMDDDRGSASDSAYCTKNRRVDFCVKKEGAETVVTRGLSLRESALAVVSRR